MTRTGIFFRSCFRKIPAEAAAFILTCILMSLPFLLAQKSQERTPQKSSGLPFVIMVSGAGLSEEELRNLEYWEMAASPSIFTKTDFNGPVSGPVHRKYLAGLDSPVTMENLSETVKDLPAFPLEQRSAADLELSLAIPVKEPSPAQTAAAGRFVSDDSGKEIPGVECSVPENIPKGIKPTVLHVKPSGNSGLPPSVRVAVSCGNTAFDVLALRSAGNYAVRTAFSGTMIFDWQSAGKEKKP